MCSAAGKNKILKKILVYIHCIFMHKHEHVHKPAILPAGSHVEENVHNCAEEEREKGLDSMERKLIELNMVENMTEKVK
jgi:hypothetical protein